MAVRELISRHQRLSICIAIAAIGLGVIAILVEGHTSVSHAERTKGKIWFSDDDGKTWFVDDESRIPPFSHNGKPAYRAYVYTCDGGKTQFVAFLARFTPAGKARIQRAQAMHEPLDIRQARLSPASGLEVKKPGQTQWLRASDLRASAVQQPSCPDGTDQNLAPVFP